MWVCFLEKKRKHNINGEFAKKFETVVSVELLESDIRRSTDEENCFV